MWFLKCDSFVFMRHVQPTFDQAIIIPSMTGAIAACIIKWRRHVSFLRKVEVNHSWTTVTTVEVNIGENSGVFTSILGSVVIRSTEIYAEIYLFIIKLRTSWTWSYISADTGGLHIYLFQRLTQFTISVVLKCC